MMVLLLTIPLYKHTHTLYALLDNIEIEINDKSKHIKNL